MKNRKKNYIALFLILALMLGLLGACKKSVKGIVITDNEGKTRVLATNEKGETMTDEAGNIIIVVTDVDGKAETNRVAMPDSYISGDTIQTKTYTLVIPKGWEKAEGLGEVSLKHKKTESEIIFVKMDDKPLEYAIDSMEQFVEPIKEQGGTMDITQTTIYGVEVAQYTMSADDKNITTFYIFEKNGVVYSFYTTSTKEDKDNVDFEAVLNSVVFK